MKRQTLGTLAGTSSNTIRNYEEGLTFPKLSTLGRIAQVLEVDIRWLIDGQEA